MAGYDLERRARLLHVPYNIEDKHGRRGYFVGRVYSRNDGEYFVYRFEEKLPGKNSPYEHYSRRIVNKMRLEK